MGGTMISTTISQEEQQTQMMQMGAYLLPLIEQERKQPRNTVLSLLVNAHEQGHEGLRPGHQSFIEGFEGAFAADRVAEEDRQKVNHLVAPKAPPCKADPFIDGGEDPLLAQVLDKKHYFPQPTGG